MVSHTLGLLWTIFVDSLQLLSFQSLFDLFLLYVLYRLGRWLYSLKDKHKERPPRTFELSSKLFGKGKSIACFNPGTGETQGEVKCYTREEVNEVVARARVAYDEWKNTSFKERRAVLSDLLETILENQDEICRYSIQDSGKTSLEAKYGEILTTCEKLRYLINHGADCLKPEERSPPLLLFLKKARVEYYPIGIVGIIVPWNYPFHNVASAVSAALFAGNAAVVKVSECSLGSKDYFEGLFRKVLAKRGFNPELVTLVAGEGETGAALVESAIDKVLFIGSPATGKRVMTSAAKNLTPVILELGGKDPFIVLDDAELDQATQVALRGAFVNCGQNCIAAERIYVQEGVYDEFVDSVTKIVRNFKQGPAIKGGCYDCGAMTMERQVEIVDELVQDAIANGAKLVSGGKRNEKLSGLFYEPTLLVDVDQSMRIVNEEVFGPVMLVIKFKDDHDVIKKANGTEYALGCSIFSTNYARAEALAKEIVSGMCTINDFGISYLIQALPFGGAKISGFGRFNGPEGLREFSRIKSVVTDRFPLRPKAPRFTQFPIPDYAPTLVTAAINTIYGSNIVSKITNGITLIKMMINDK